MHIEACRHEFEVNLVTQGLECSPAILRCSDRGRRGWSGHDGRARAWGLARAGSSWELGWPGVGAWAHMEYGPWGPKGLALNPGSVVYSQGDLCDFLADFTANLTSQIPHL